MLKQGIVAIVAVVALVAFGGQALAQGAGNGLTDEPQAGEVSLVPVGPPFGGKWKEFSFGATGSFAKGCTPADPAGSICVASSAGNSEFVGAPPWTFTAPKSGIVLTVTDAFLNGDRFEVFNGATNIGDTPAVAKTGSCAPGDSSDPEVCVKDPKSSHRVYSLGGSQGYSLTIKAIDTVSPGAAYFRLDLRCDANGDGKVNIQDAIAVLEHLLLGTPLKGRPGQADCNGDGKVNFADVFAILQAR